MTKNILFISLFGLLLPPHEALAQPLDAADTAEIRQKARRHVRQFEGLLNLIAQPDEYFRKYGFEGLIRSYYDSTSSYRIFRDSLVVVEDDLNPRTRVQRYGHLLAIKEYLKAFFSLYEKSPVTSVFFNRYRVSEVKQDDFTYVEVRYESEFRNRHRAYPQVPYPVRPRKATVKAERTPRGWRVVITDVSYDRPAAPEQASTHRLAATKPPVTHAIAQLPSTPVASVPAPALDTAVADTRSFGSLRATYRLGKTYDLSLSPTVSPGASLLLYRDEQLVEDVSAVLADSAHTWLVPRQLDAGNGYYFRLLDPMIEAPIESTPFALRSRARWPWVVAAAAAAVVVVAVMSGGNDDDADDELPAPPNPN